MAEYLAGGLEEKDINLGAEPRPMVWRDDWPIRSGRKLASCREMLLVQSLVRRWGCQRE